MSLASMLPVPVLWPDDVRKGGYFYGWTTPVACVVDVLDVDTVSCAIVYDRRPLSHKLRIYSSTKQTTF